MILLPTFFSCFKKWSTDLWPLNGSIIHATFPFHKWGQFPHDTCERRWRLHHWNCKISSLDNSAFRTSPEAIISLTKQFPRWSRITLWFNKFFKELSAKIIILFHTGLPHADPYTWKWVYLLRKVLFVCFVWNQWDFILIIELILIIGIEVLCNSMLRRVIVGWDNLFSSDCFLSSRFGVISHRSHSWMTLGAYIPE